MRQVNYSKYGSSSVLKVTTVEKTELTDSKSILIKISYSSLNAIDWKNRKGDFRFVSGMFKPRTKQGFDVTGTIIERGSNVTDFEIGDRVVALLGNFKGGSLSEYVCIHVKDAVKIPHSLSFKQVAGLPMAGTTAWMALIEVGKMKQGDKVLINGGSSGVGHLAIQVAKAYGAEVYSISSTRNKAFCKQLGADLVVSYQETDMLKIPETFDIVFDVAFTASYKSTKQILAKNGVYIGTTPPAMLWEYILYKNAKFVAVHPHKKALEALLNLMEKKQLDVAVEKVYKLEEIVEAHQHIEKSRTRGKILVEIAK